MILYLGTVASDSARAEVQILNVGETVCTVVLQGEITLEDAAKLKRLECPRVIIYLGDSPGGDVQAAMAIGRWARQRNAFILSGPSYCYSSCALVYIGGASRLNQGEIGLHRPYLVGPPRTTREVQELVQAMFEDLRDYVAEMRVAPAFAEIMITTAPAEMRRYRKAEIEDLVPAHDPVYEEQEVARNARIYGISTEEYRRRDIETDLHCDINSFLRIQSHIPPMILHENCEQAIYWGLSQSVYERRSELAERTCDSLMPLDVNHSQPARGGQLESIALWDEYLDCRIAVMRGIDWPQR